MVESFVKHHPEISLPLPESLQYAGALGWS